MVKQSFDKKKKKQWWFNINLIGKTIVSLWIFSSVLPHDLLFFSQTFFYVFSRWLKIIRIQRQQIRKKLRNITWMTGVIHWSSAELRCGIISVRSQHQRSVGWQGWEVLCETVFYYLVRRICIQFNYLISLINRILLLRFYVPPFRCEDFHEKTDPHNS